MEEKKIKTVHTNKKAWHNFEIVETVEAGIVLSGSEVKSVRAGSVSLSDSFVRIKDNEAYLINSYIAPYEKSSAFNHDPESRRKLLLHKIQIMKMSAKVKERGYTIVPLKVYFKGSLVKIEIALVRGKRDFEKNRAKKERNEKRAAERKYKRIYS